MKRRRKYLWVVLILGLLLGAVGFGTYLLPRLPAGTSEMREANYRLAFTFTPGAVPPSSDPLALPRVNAGGPGTEEEKLSKMLEEEAVT